MAGRRLGQLFRQFLRGNADTPKRVGEFVGALRRGEKPPKRFGEIIEASRRGEKPPVNITEKMLGQIMVMKQTLLAKISDNQLVAADTKLTVDDSAPFRQKERFGLRDTSLEDPREVEHVIRKKSMMAANEILDIFCERFATRFYIISKQRQCPDDLNEAISSLIFVAPRCSDIPAILAMGDVILNKYGMDFVSAAFDLHPDSGVNSLLSALNPPAELKLKVLKKMAKEYQVVWDTADTEAELLKPPEGRIAEYVMREQTIMTANGILDLFCERLVSRLYYCKAKGLSK